MYVGSRSLSRASAASEGWYDVKGAGMSSLVDFRRRDFMKATVLGGLLIPIMTAADGYRAQNQLSCVRYRLTRPVGFAH